MFCDEEDNVFLLAKHCFFGCGSHYPLERAISFIIIPGLSGAS